LRLKGTISAGIRNGAIGEGLLRIKYLSLPKITRKTLDFRRGWGLGGSEKKGKIMGYCSGWADKKQRIFVLKIVNGITEHKGNDRSENSDCLTNEGDMEL